MTEDGPTETFRPPPQRPGPIIADPAEVLALRVIVGVFIAMFAKRNEAFRGEHAQLFVNDMSAVCQEALLSAQLDIADGRDLEPIRRQAIEHVNRIVGTGVFDDRKTGSN